MKILYDPNKKEDVGAVFLRIKRNVGGSESGIFYAIMEAQQHKEKILQFPKPIKFSNKISSLRIVKEKHQTTGGMKVGNHPKINISNELSDIHLVYGQTFTLWLQEKESKRRHQVEIRITENGGFEMFLNKKENPIKIKDFSEWAPIKQASGGKK